MIKKWIGKLKKAINRFNGVLTHEQELARIVRCEACGLALATAAGLPIHRKECRGDGSGPRIRPTALGLAVAYAVNKPLRRWEAAKGGVWLFIMCSPVLFVFGSPGIIAGTLSVVTTWGIWEYRQFKLTDRFYGRRYYR